VNDFRLGLLVRGLFDFIAHGAFLRA